MAERRKDHPGTGTAHGVVAHPVLYSPHLQPRKSTQIEPARRGTAGNDIQIGAQQTALPSRPVRECRETPVQPLQTLAVSGSSSVTPTLVRVAAESPGHSLSEAIDERGDPASKEWHLIVPAGERAPSFIQARLFLLAILDTGP
jgi:hypothetical protein